MDRGLRVASLFCGCGGTDVGMEGDFDYLGKHYDATGIKIVYANDIEKSACDIFEENFGLRPDNRDIRDVVSEELPQFDILTGGFPCQSFSIVAQNPPRLGIKDDRGKLFFEMCRILREKQPACFVAENVKNSAYEIIEKKKATYYGVAMAVKRICEAIVRDEKSILPISSLMKGDFGIEGISLSMPAIVGKDGVECLVPIQLNEEEISKLQQSAQTLKNTLSQNEV